MLLQCCIFGGYRAAVWVPDVSISKGISVLEYVSKPFGRICFKPIRKKMFQSHSKEYVPKSFRRTCFKTIRKDMFQNHSEEYVSKPFGKIPLP